MVKYAPREVDLLIVGAGLHGLTMAKTYLQTDPSANILVVDEAASVGGTWARERLYPGLVTNNVFGSYELSDFPLVPEKYGVAGVGHIPGSVAHSYFCDVADYFGITPCLMLRRRVARATLDERWWIVRVECVDGSKEAEDIIARRLVIATGLTSTPSIPQLPGSDRFTGLMLHSKQLKEQAHTLAKCQNVVVLGANKSAWDVCYRAAKSGAQVHMVIRPSGGGPSYVWPRSFFIGPWKVSLAKISATRGFSLFDPTLFGERGAFSWIREFLHRTLVGSWLCQLFWSCLDKHIKSINGYRGNPEVQKLEPWTTPFWMGNSLSIHNYETSWFDLVREGKIHVHIARVTDVSTNSVHIAGETEETLNADAIVCCTGWKAEVPVDIPSTTCDKQYAKAHDEILQRIPYLSSSQRTRNAPPTGQKNQTSETVPAPELYRHIVPCDRDSLRTRNIAFIGMHSCLHAFIVAQAQALWITAFFEDQVNHLRDVDHEVVEYNTALHSAYTRLRRPKELGGSGGKYPDLVFDSLPYVDVLLNDVAVESNRKGSWWRELTEPYRPGDYVGLVDEWLVRTSS
ncbi:FAD/NAD(P)-binding domain-containing protein [Aspergillus campestris IBT 28561]|uniref:FAD/NAD(P)-binding domain-containing protein n=1 Tax=Aspergillus campestris (strain IBT 28561) TaxID=1392248 RepID=A0A2I1CRB4_ASPC2|nr:FAD/NAD(P)-binding domain-containing protein [Aspergillus campestris IBT 28561]PKY00157.1 FAD/NAD(P)-binding domain-containing protein [Aspergillus campestris IBT 28561]